ncbi:MAG TPA: dihydrofolate reductase family protein [Gaiellaceae bacterium]|nr:dihydrofolate reductase family protein [Gaiellaceae bacterium]
MTYWMNVSLDLRIERSAGDHVADEEGGEWVRIDEQLFREFNERARSLALFVEGRVIYEMMETVWPSAAQDESLPDHLREWGEIWTAAPKVLVSSSRTTASHNTRIVGGADAITQLAAIRDETEGTIGVGGATLATQLLQHGLLDELLLYTHPAILGSGRPLFDEVTEPLECDLLEHATFDNGVALNRYQIRGQRTE